MTDSPAIAAAKARADATEYMAKYGPDPTFWTHFIDWREATSADWQAAIDVTPVAATVFLDHLRTMRDIAAGREAFDAPTDVAAATTELAEALYEANVAPTWERACIDAERTRDALADYIDDPIRVANTLQARARLIFRSES